MTIFDDRRRAFEARFKHEQDLRFKITARRNRLFGEWAAKRLGLSDEDADAYAKSIVEAQFARSGVVGQVERDFRQKGVEVTGSELQTALARSGKDARRQIAPSGRISAPAHP